MAKSILFLLTLALIAASNSKISGAVAAADEDAADLAQRQATMAESMRVFLNPKLSAAADSETVHRMAAFMKSEIGPVGPILDAIRKMPEESADDVRVKYEARDAAFDLLIRHFGTIMPQQGCAKTDDL